LGKMLLQPPARADGDIVADDGVSFRAIGRQIGYERLRRGRFFNVVDLVNRLETETAMDGKVGSPNI
jgi:hypothetical protein